MGIVRLPIGFSRAWNGIGARRLTRRERVPKVKERSIPINKLIHNINGEAVFLLHPCLDDETR